MKTAEAVLGNLAGLLWGNWMLFVLLGLGVFYAIATGCIQFRSIPWIIKEFCKKEDRTEPSRNHKGTVSSVQALYMAIASCVGSGNIVGVATALIGGGPGALFWMWAAAFLGMATKYAEIVLGLVFRQKGVDGSYYGGPMYYIEKGLHTRCLGVAAAVLLFFQNAGGTLIQNFFTLATFTDPQRTTSFPQTWTMFYWAYWMVWAVAAPFFIGSISKGRTVKQTILGGYVFGLGGTFTSFIILGNYSLGLQVSGRLDVMGIYNAGQDLYATIIAVINTLPMAQIVLVLLALAMVTFYATSFDAIALVASAYSYKEIPDGEEPHMGVKVFWSLMLILLPIALVFSDSSMANLQTVSIIAAFPLAAVILLIVASFLKDGKKYLEENRK